jgi:hypothetical protein
MLVVCRRIRIGRVEHRSDQLAGEEVSAATDLFRVGTRASVLVVSGKGDPLRENAMTLTLTEGQLAGTVTGRNGQENPISEAKLPTMRSRSRSRSRWETGVSP